MWPRSCAGGVGRGLDPGAGGGAGPGLGRDVDFDRDRKRRPSIPSWQRIRQTLGITEPLLEEAWRQQPREISDQLVATLGACLAAVRAATLAELAAATGVPISEVRLALRQLAEQLETTGMQVLYDGSHVQLAPDPRFYSAVGHLVQPEQLPRLSQEQAEVLAIVIVDGMATQRRIEEVRGAARLSIEPDGPGALPRDSSETLALLLSRGLLCAERDDHAPGRPLVYRPTPRLLQLLGAETLEEARGRMQRHVRDVNSRSDSLAPKHLHDASVLSQLPGR